MTDYTVLIEVRVRAEGHIEAAESAFSQVRDQKRGTFEAMVTASSGQSQSVLLEAAKGTARPVRVAS